MIEVEAINFMFLSCNRPVCHTAPASSPTSVATLAGLDCATGRCPALRSVFSVSFDMRLQKKKRKLLEEVEALETLKKAKMQALEHSDSRSIHSLTTNRSVRSAHPSAAEDSDDDKVLSSN